MAVIMHVCMYVSMNACMQYFSEQGYVIYGCEYACMYVYMYACMQYFAEQGYVIYCCEYDVCM